MSQRRDEQGEKVLVQTGQHPPNMDEREYRDQPVANPVGQWMVPSDRMVVRRYKNLDYLESILEKGFRAQKADKYEELEGRASPPTLKHEEENWELNGVTFEDDSSPDLS